MPAYGSVDWFEAQYGAGGDDPWGLDWRPTQQYRYGAMIGELLGKLRNAGLPGGLVLDIGCSTGGFTRVLGDALVGAGAYRIVGIDLSRTAIERAKQRSQGIEYRVGSLENTAADFGATASIVVCLEVIYYTPPERRAAAIESLRAMAKPGALLLISSMIGKRPYLSYEELVALVAPRFSVVGGGCLSLWPLVVLEKLWLKIAKSRRPSSPGRFLPGAAGHARIESLARLCRSAFGRRAESHAYVIARALPGLRPAA